MLATRVLAPNPGPMTLDGTNSYIVRRPDSHQLVVIDPGPVHSRQLRRLVSHGSVELIVLTHHHSDHSESAGRLAALTGAPVRAAEASLCINGSPLSDGEIILAGGTAIRVVATPGHTADSTCLYLPEDRELDAAPVTGSMLTGDTILGRSTTVIAQPDGSLRDYFASLRRLTTFGHPIVLPGHGSLLSDLTLVARHYIDRRTARLKDVESAVAQLSMSSATGFTVAAVTDLVYADIDPKVRSAAESSVAAQLKYLAESVHMGEAGHDR